MTQEASRKLTEHVPEGSPEDAAAAMAVLAVSRLGVTGDLVKACRVHVEAHVATGMHDAGYGDYLAALLTLYDGKPGRRAREILAAKQLILNQAPDVTPVTALNLLEACIDAGVPDAELLSLAVEKVNARRTELGSAQLARFLGVLARVALAHERLIRCMRPMDMHRTLSHLRRSRTTMNVEDLVSAIEHVALLNRHVPALATHEVNTELAECLGRVQRFDEKGVTVGPVVAARLLYAFGLVGLKARNHIAALVAILEG